MVSSEKTKFALAIVLILLAQVIIFPRTAPKFFDGDAFFYFAHHLDSWDALRKCILAPDAARQYRPLGQILFSYFFYPLFRLDYSLYGMTALAFHMASTLILFKILRRLLKSLIPVVTATIFWGLHPVAIYVTHSFSFLADFTFGFFYLLAILFYLKFIDTGKIYFAILVLISFVTSLVCKEAAVTLPVVLAFISGAFLSQDVDHSVLMKRARWVLVILFAGLAVYLGGYLFMKEGRFYDSGSKQNYYFDFSFNTLLHKAEYFLSAFFMPLPDYHQRPNTVVGASRLALFTFPFLTAFFLYLVWPGLKRSPKILYGFFLFFIMILPVLFITPREFTHNIYLPVIGLAIATGIFIEDLVRLIKQSKWVPHQLVYLYGLAIVVASLLINQQVFLKIDWRPHYENVARSAVESLRKIHPNLPHQSALYIIRSSVPAFPWLVYDGLFFKIFNNDPTISVRFEEWDDPFPHQEISQKRGYVLAFAEGRFYDMTKSYMEEIVRVKGINLLKSFKDSDVYVPTSFKDQASLGTPDNKYAFISTVVRNDEARVSMVSLASTRVRFDIPPLEKQSKLILGTALQFDIGDGAEGRIYFETNDSRTLVYSRFINTKDRPEDRVWHDEVIPLGQFAGNLGALIFECNAGAKDNADADWFLWSRMVLEGVDPTYLPLKLQ